MIAPRWNGIALLAVAAAGLVARADEVLLRRYTPVTVYRGFTADQPGGDTYTYMDAEDTHIARAQPDLSYGAAERLAIGDPADAILIAFRQLNRAIPPGAEIGEVELVLAPDGQPDLDAIVELHRIVAPWRDGASIGAAQDLATTYNCRFSGTSRTRREWSAPGGRGELAEKPSAAGKLGDFWNAQRGAFVFGGAALAEDVRYWLGRRFRNHGWMLTIRPSAAGMRAVSFFAGDAYEAEKRPALRIVYAVTPVTRPDLPDLDVTYIERTPRFTRYHDNWKTSYERKLFRGDNVGIMKQPEHADEKKWPEPGETVTFVAHVKNAGTQPVAGPVEFVWRMNEREVGRGRLEGGLAPWAEQTAKLEWKWDVDHGDHRSPLLEFEVDPADAVREITENNNWLSKYAVAKTLKYWVERGTYEYVKDYPTAWGSYSFEDYLQWHFDMWNETFFDKSRFDGVAPDGCLERTTLDDFAIVDDGVLDGPVHRPHDQHDPLFDGEWGTTWELSRRDVLAEEERKLDAEKPAAEEREKRLADAAKRQQQQHDDFLKFLRTRRVFLEGSLLHEASHQTIGAYDVYWSNIEPSEPDKPVGKCRLKDETGHYITRGSMYPFGGLMGGSDTRPNERYTEGTGLYEVNTVGGVNTNLPYRNGFYGDWLYDLPVHPGVRMTCPDGTPLRNARITIWQSHGMTIDEAGLVTTGWPADEEGRASLPHQESLEDDDYTTRTGHTLRKQNSWGRLDVVGGNMTLLIRVDAFGQRDYRFVRSIDFNSGYWTGNKFLYTLPLECRICPSDKIDFATNVAAGATVRASCGADSAAKIVDGDVSTNWDGGNTKAGDWIEIELSHEQRVGVIQLVQDGHHGSFFQRFEIRTRTGALGGDELFASQTPLKFSWAMANEKDANPARPTERWVTYASSPRPTRVVRIEALDGGWARLHEIRIFAEK